MDHSVKRTGYWPLTVDARDREQQGRHGEATAVDYEEGALFDGVSSMIRLPDLSETDGTRPFTLSMQFKIHDQQGALPGGLCGRYEEKAMEGWHLSILTQAGVTTTQANWRNLQFGWTGAQSEEQWKLRGTPGNCRQICSLCVYAGHLYAGTFDDAYDHKGRVYRLDEGDNWIDCGNPDDSNAVRSLAEYKGRLYAGTMRYKAAGSKLPESPNQVPGGKVYRYEGGQSWSLFAVLPESDSVGCLTVYQDRLIAMSFYSPGVYAFQEDGTSEPLGAPGPEGRTRTITLAPFRGDLYAGGNQTMGVFSRTLDRGWSFRGTVPKCDQVYSFVVYHNELMMGMWHEARMLKYAGGTDWIDCGRMAQELEVMGVAMFNGRLYAGTLPGGHVYRYEGGQRWELAGVLEPQDENIIFRRVWSMAVYRGELYAGTLPGGKVWSMYKDPLATCDRSLSSEWHRATIVYDLRHLQLYLDGQLISTAAVPEQGIIPTGHIPFVLGKGPQSHFSGMIREVELFDGALTEASVKNHHLISSTLTK